MNDTPTYAHIDWSRRHFASMAEGGVWSIPRSGMIFQRRGDALVLIERMPHDPQMPITAAELDQQQRDEFDVVKKHFNAAGIAVRWEAGDL